MSAEVTETELDIPVLLDVMVTDCGAPVAPFAGISDITAPTTAPWLQLASLQKVCGSPPSTVMTKVLPGRGTPSKTYVPGAAAVPVDHGSPPFRQLHVLSWQLSPS
jgi:hypothetical protein